MNKIFYIYKIWGVGLYILTDQYPLDQRVFQENFNLCRKALNLLNIDVLTYNFVIEIGSLFHWSKIAILQESCIS
jgi:hypothetical protein